MNKISIMTAFLLIACFVSEARAQQAAQQPVPVTLSKVSDNIYEIKGGRGANGGVYIGEDGVLLIDAKQDEASVKETLARVGELTSKPVVYVVNTHADGDHVYGNRFLSASATFIAHENCRKEFFLPNMRGEASDWSSPALSAFLPEVTYGEKMDIYLGAERIELWYFGVGHTTGDTVIYFPDEKVAFIGDQFFSGRPQLIHAYKGGNSFQHVTTLKRMLDTLDAQKFCNGHSDPGDRKAIADHIAGMQAMQAEVEGLMKKHVPLDAIQKEFKEDEATLISVIYNELSK
jgi:cyclase